jgi:hypothetical protein
MAAAKAKECLRLQHAAVSTVHWHEVVVYQRRGWDTNKSHSSVDKRLWRFAFVSGAVGIESRSSGM